MSPSLTLNVLEFDGNVQAALVEVGGSFVVVEALVHFGHLFVSFETVACRLLTPSNLTLLQRLTDQDEVVRCLLKGLLKVLVEAFLLHELVTWLDAAWRCLIGQIEEVDIGLHKALRKKVNADVGLVFALFELEAAVLFDWSIQLASTCCLLRLLTSCAILFQDLCLGGSDQLILLLRLGLLDDLANTGVRVENRLVLHLASFV